jgi:hypothetical protein
LVLAKKKKKACREIPEKMAVFPNTFKAVTGRYSLP